MTKLVTFLYFGLGDFPFFGHKVQARWDRYINSLVQLSQMGLPIVCYTGSNTAEALQDFLDENEVTNVTVKVKELEDIRHSKKMIEIKEKNPDKFKFYLEVGWAKIALMEDEMEEGLDYLYWIDCGLSHIGLYPRRYNSNADKITGLSVNKYRYTYDGIFNTETFPKINNWVGDKLIDIRNTLFFHDHRKLNEILDKDHMYDSLSIGGIIGGHVSKLPDFFQRFEDYAQTALRKEFLLNHEAIMATMVYDKPENYRSYKFNTWYHDDSSLTDKSVTPEFLKDKISFYTFFEQL
jgi:hypothetical protein